MIIFKFSLTIVYEAVDDSLISNIHKLFKTLRMLYKYNLITHFNNVSLFFINKANCV